MMLLSCFLAITRQIYCWLIHKVLQTLWLRAGNSQRADINVSRSSSLHSALAGALARSSRAKVIWFPAVVITTAAKCYFSPLAFSTYSIIFLGRTVLFHLLSEANVSCDDTTKYYCLSPISSIHTEPGRPRTERTIVLLAMITSKHSWLSIKSLCSGEPWNMRHSSSKHVSKVTMWAKLCRSET